MFTCEECGRKFSAGAVAVVGLPHPVVCPTCRRAVAPPRRLSDRARHLLIVWIWSAVALTWLAIMLWSEWKRDDHWPDRQWPDGDEIQHKRSGEELPSPGADEFQLKLSDEQIRKLRRGVAGGRFVCRIDRDPETQRLRARIMDVDGNVLMVIDDHYNVVEDNLPDGDADAPEASNHKDTEGTKQ